MEKEGVIINGFLAGTEEKVGEYDGVRKVTYRYLIVSGMESYLVTSDTDYRDKMMIHDMVSFSVVPRVFSGKLFWGKGVLVE